MKKLRFILMLLLAALCAFSFAACGSDSAGNPQEKEEPAPRVYEDGTYTLLDFEKEEDIFSVRPFNPDILDAYGKVSVTFGEQFVSGENPEKDGSLKYAYKSGKRPALILYPERSECYDMPFDKLLSFDISIYNCSEKAKKVILSIVSTTEEVYSVSQKLEHGWNDCELELDAVFVKYRQEDIYAFCIEFESGESCDYYLDDWKATIGESEYTEVQKNAATFVDAVEKTGDNVSVESVNNLISAFTSYSELNDICKAAVKKYYEKFGEQVEKYFEIIGWSSEVEQETELLYFGDEFGVLQLLGNENARFCFDSEKIDETKKGRLKFSFEKNEGKHVFDFITPTIVIANYDYLSFSLTNETAGEVTFFFNDSDYKEVISAGETQEIHIPIKEISESDNAFTLDVSASGDVYVTEVKAVALLRDKMYEQALREEPFVGQRGSVVFENGDNKHIVKTQSSAVEFKLNKADYEVNVAQSVSFAVTANTACSLILKNSSGAEIKTISVSAKTRIVSLTKAEYDETFAIRVRKANVELEFSDFLLSREADEDYVSVLLLSDHVVKGADVTIKTFKEATYYLRTFENMILYKQNYMQTNDASVYEEISARANSVSIIMSEMTTRLKGGTASDEDCEILLGLSDTYLSLKTVQPLSAEKLKALSAAKKGVLMNYKYNIFDFENPSAASLFTQDTEFYACNWDVKTENFDGKNVLAVDGTKPSKENYYYIHYDFSSAENVINEYDYVVWRIYNDSAWTRELYYIMRGWNYGMIYGTYVLPARQWTEFTMSANDFANAGYMVLYEGIAGDKYYFDNVSAYSVQYVKSKIEALPDAEKISAKDRGVVNEAKTAYDKLSVAGKAKVNAAKLMACVEKLAAMPYDFFDMSDPSVLERFTHPTDIPSYTWNGDFSLTTEAEKGSVLALNTTGSTGKEPCVYFGFNLSGLDISNYKNVKFSVYNPKKEILILDVITRGWGVPSAFTANLAPESWTELTIPVQALLDAAWENNTGYIYIKHILPNETVTLLFGNFVAYP